MYSPKIKDDLISVLYRKAQLLNKSMTEVVDEMLRPLLIESSTDENKYTCHNCKTEVEIVVEDSQGYCDHCESVVFIDKS